MKMSSRYSFASSKSGKSGGRAKDSAIKQLEPKVADIKDLSNVPLIGQNDIGRVLPKYSAVISRRADEGVAMDDLDQLQQDLEKLLSTNAIRTRFFLGEYSQAAQKGQVSLKRKRPDDKPKGNIRLMKRDPFRSMDAKKDIPKIQQPRNDNSDKFWASIDPYCAAVQNDDIVFLDDLISECSQQIDCKISEVGDHYTSNWTDDLLGTELNLGRNPSKKLGDFRKSGLQAMVDSIGVRHKQIPALSKNENGIKSMVDKIKDLAKIRQNIGQDVGSCLDKRLLKVLSEQGLIKPEDINQNNPQDDEFVTEINKCRNELIAVNQHNLQELNKLRTAAVKDIHNNQLKDNLNKVDKEVLDLYNNIMHARLKDEGKDYEKIFSQKMVSEFEAKANALLRQQHVLNREINSSTDMSMLY